MPVEPSLHSLFWWDISSLARYMRVAGQYVFGVISSKRTSSLCSRLNCTIPAPMEKRCRASLPVLKSRSLNSYDSSSRNDCSGRPRHLRPWGRCRAIPLRQRPAPTLVVGTNITSRERTRSAPAIRRETDHEWVEVTFSELALLSQLDRAERQATQEQFASAAKIATRTVSLARSRSR